MINMKNDKIKALSSLTIIGTIATVAGGFLMKIKKINKTSYWGYKDDSEFYSYDVLTYYFVAGDEDGYSDNLREIESLITGDDIYTFERIADMFYGVMRTTKQRFSQISDQALKNGIKISLLGCSRENFFTE